jgi:hypothetical protein
MTHDHDVDVRTGRQHLLSSHNSARDTSAQNHTHTLMKVRGMLNFRAQCSTACLDTSTMAVTSYKCDINRSVGSYTNTALANSLGLNGTTYVYAHCDLPCADDLS